MAKNLTPQQIAEKHNRRTKAAIEDMRIGVNAVTENPCAKAAAKQEKMKARLIESIDSGKWSASLKRVSLDEWKSKMINVGIARVSAGLDANKAKVEAFFSELMPYVTTLQQKLSTMPDTTLEDSINKMGAWTRGMAQFKRKA